MDKKIRTFLEDAGRIRLTAEEKQTIRGHMHAFLRGEDMEQLDAEAHAFFAHAKSVGLLESELHEKRSMLRAFIASHPVRMGVFSRLYKRMSYMRQDVSRPDKHSLTQAEKEELRKQMRRFMDGHPKEDAPPIPDDRAASWLTLFLQGVVPRTAILACAFLIVGSGAAYAAGDSVPGDFLYPLKVDVVEQIRARLTFTAQQKVEWESSRALRRLEEAERLAADNRLTQDTWVRLHGNFLEHVAEAESHIDAVAQSGDTQTAQNLSVKLESYLRAHQRVTTSDGSYNNEIRNAIESVQKGIIQRTTEEYAPSQTADGEDKNKTDAQNAVMQALRAVEARRGDGMEKGSAADKALEKADAILTEASTQLDGGLFEEAAALARDAMRAAQEASTLNALPITLPRGAIPAPTEDIPHSSSRASSSAQATVSSSSTQPLIDITLPDMDIDLDLEDVDVEVPGL